MISLLSRRLLYNIETCEQPTRYPEHSIWVTSTIGSPFVMIDPNARKTF